MALPLTWGMLIDCRLGTNILKPREDVGRPGAWGGARMNYARGPAGAFPAAPPVLGCTGAAPLAGDTLSKPGIFRPGAETQGIAASGLGPIYRSI
ncbi:MAG: hypothetical protein A3F83_14325 [Candidatus Glassbacteria bacterium RIFCSPLOWO2_12_FULL_58_11]|uniref:Uncharacterized protein n=1 Tax=Candidatus Glassbacteria bacterium RIFCSPLOWO2_12_FULL_58_11 TaxID=1817867 RepID=A0A1F5YZ75_9BACT|nr:MAG: hypothetical protein A3F83_14325 [Candidatus Glassbacteria bacterium RIFCSPLOWO2_12_FULL_58_11]